MALMMWTEQMGHDDVIDKTQPRLGFFNQSEMMTALSKKID